MSGSVDTLYAMHIAIKQVVDDIDKRSKDALERFPRELLKLPRLSDMKNMEKFYSFYNSCMIAYDEIITIMCRLDLVITQMEDIKNTKMGRDLSNNYTELKAFKGYLIDTISKFKTYRYDLLEIRNSYNHKLKLLQSIMYKEIIV